MKESSMRKNGKVGVCLGESEVGKSNLHNNNNKNNNNGHMGDHSTKEEPYVYTEICTLKAYNSKKKQQMTEIY